MGRILFKPDFSLLFFLFSIFLFSRFKEIIEWPKKKTNVFFPTNIKSVSNVLFVIFC